jgi:hypothetical protein
MISGLLPLEAEIHTKVFIMFGNITRAHKNSTEWKLAERQLHIKNAKNYRGITVTPTLSKIIEKILKIRAGSRPFSPCNPVPMRLYVALLAFADDVALIAYNPLDIQTMVDSRFQQT